MPITTRPSPSSFESIDLRDLASVQGGCHKKACNCAPVPVPVPVPTPVAPPPMAPEISTSISVSYQ
jgi:hypothetical protein